MFLGGIQAKSGMVGNYGIRGKIRLARETSNNGLGSLGFVMHSPSARALRIPSTVITIFCFLFWPCRVCKASPLSIV